MKNERDEIYKAFSSISPVDEKRKREILDHVLNERREKTMKFNYIRIAVPALVALLICINIAIVKNSPDIMPSASYSESESQSDIEINRADESTQTSEETTDTKDIKETKNTEITKDTKESTEKATETKATTVTQQTTKTSAVTTATTKNNTQQNITTKQTEKDIPETTSETEPDLWEQIDTATQQQETGSWLPPIQADAKDVFEKAYDIYYQIGVGNQLLSTEPTEIDGQVWFEVIDDRFHNLQEFKDYLARYFSSEWLDSWEIYSQYMDYNGKLYSTGGGKSDNVAYRGHTFQIISDSDTKIEFNATIYCSDDMDNAKPYFYTTPSNPENYYTFDRYFRMIKENGVWVVDWMQPLF